MTETDDEQIKAEIDGIMQGVKNIMQKIEDAMPKTESGLEQIKDTEDTLNSSKSGTAD
jgi:hypothetical protein